MKIINIKSVYEEIKKNKKAIADIITYAKSGDLDAFTPPSTLVGEFNYPKVSVGVMFTTNQDAYMYDSPKYWVRTGYDVSKIFSIRNTLVNAKEHVDVRKPNEKFMQEVALATMSKTDVAINLNIEKINQSGLLSNVLAPHGLTAEINHFKLNENVRMDKSIEKVYYDHDFKATGAMQYLYQNGIDENKISKILSVGALGVKRRLVPTKWAITAADDVLGKQMIEEIKNYESSDTSIIKSGIVLGNHFTIIFMPGEWSFELIEAWNREGDNLMIGESDYEFYGGRKEYVKNTAGAYYAIRLAVLEKMRELKRQFSVLVIREITPAYFAPLGVWVVREGARKILDDQSEEISDFATAMKTAKAALIYQVDFERRSKILNVKEKQRKLFEF